MKLRCPYCRLVFERLAERSRCPHCGKTVRMPDLKLTRPHSASPGDELGDARKRGPFRRSLKLPKTPLPWILLGRQPRILLWMLLTAVVIIGKILLTGSSNPLPVIRSDESRTRKELLIMRTALEWFYFDCRRYPTTEEGLKALVRDPGVPGWKGYYVTQLPTDLWRHPYQYSCTNEQITLFCLGRDGLAGTADDIPSPAPDYKALMERVAVTNVHEAPVSPIP